MVVFITIVILLVLWWYLEYRKNNNLKKRIARKGGMYNLYMPLINHFKSLGFEYDNISDWQKHCFSLTGHTENFRYKVYVERTKEDYLIIIGIRYKEYREESRDWFFYASEDESEQDSIFRIIRRDFIK